MERWRDVGELMEKGWMDRWMEGRTDEWMTDLWIDRQTDGRADGWRRDL